MRKLLLYLGLLGLVWGISGYTARAETKIVKECDAFVLLVDESSSMFGPGNEGTKMETAKSILEKMNQLIPSADYQCALLGFSYDKEREESYSTKFYYPMGKYDKSKLGEVIQELEATRCWTTVGYGLEKAGELLKGVNGKLAIIVVSDGEDNSDYPRTPAEVAKNLKDTYGDRLCIYAIQVGESEEGRKVLDSVVNIVGCGKVVSAFELSDEDSMKEFVKEVFGYEEVVPPVVEKPAPPEDSDGDGVIDSLDKCPDTPKGAKVNAMGCWKPGVVYFDTDSAEIKPEFVPVLEEILNVMKLNPELKLGILGYTDSVGSEEYNYKLSLRRAEAVKQWFVEHGICGCRVNTKGFGEKYPAAPNDTEEGRARNRRVEFVIVR
ncbi:OmpA family protein [Thermosulfidibacter takaii]|nr:OmpA family protein [Thermosulfidibacter takaii]